MADYEKLLRQNQRFVCRACGGALRPSRSGEYVCTECGATEYDDFGKIRKYLEENGPQPKEKIMLETGVDRATVLRFIREQRLQAAPSSSLYLKCQACGRDILSGTLCPACRSLQNAGSAHLAGGKSGGSGHMRFLDEDNLR